MEEYSLTYQWVQYGCTGSSPFRSSNFGFRGRNWFFSYIVEAKLRILQLYREEIDEPVQLKGFVVIRTKESCNKVFEVNCRMNAGVMKTTIGSLPYSKGYYNNSTIDITCGIFITKFVERKEEIGCTCHKSIEKIPPSMNFFSKLSRDMQAMYDRHDYSDFVLVCNNLEFHAHKCLLSARSPVFAQMLQHPMLETTDNRMLIKDIDADTLEKLLLFMYSGQANPSSYSQARDLYYAADKYAVYDLKRICGEFIPSFLSSSTALETLILSDRHQDDDLMNETMTFIASVFEEIKSTEAWNIFLKENSALGTKVTRLGNESCW
ncbi:protein roadkill-like [Stegodyphus dumicola]|uniref:protein roadkill-like n=1 Tax=Stegodyphus dumicola TaxID=202533 RepID=UPI0015B29380|nr:protein roadkill-like [Stegodyphus dumicola]